MLSFKTPRWKKKSIHRENQRYLIRFMSNSREVTWSPEISGRRDTCVQSLVSYATSLHFLQTRAFRQTSRCGRYEKTWSKTLSGSLSIVWIRHNYYCTTQSKTKCIWVHYSWVQNYSRSETEFSLHPLQIWKIREHEPVAPIPKKLSSQELLICAYDDAKLNGTRGLKNASHPEGRQNDTE